MVGYVRYAAPVGTLLLTCREDALTGVWMGRGSDGDWREMGRFLWFLQSAAQSIFRREKSVILP